MEKPVTVASLGEYHSHITGVLLAIKGILVSCPRIDLNLVHGLRQSVEGHFEKLKRAIRIMQPFGLSRAFEAVDLIQEQITRRDDPGFSEHATSAGLLAWCMDMEM